ncbi:hypothetical protein AAFF_G00200500 [Aldrovandia affinis]|uniref:Uncharacterized protein n=1 Tax=Aldrovandia affinis TaxID=143900 RepID=A0AAD7W5Y7_9TELE|nr:hypothetical protein AAFF_G00200500 [Aldrovandia affinis]
MPKIKPETKVLIIKNLKSKSPAEVADIFNVSKRQVERIRKRYQEIGDVHDRPRNNRIHVNYIILVPYYPSPFTVRSSLPHRRVTFSTANQTPDLQDPSQHSLYDSGLEESETPSSKSSSGPRIGPLAVPDEQYERTTPDGSIGEVQHPESDVRSLPDVTMTGNCTPECTEFGHSDTCWMPGQPSPTRKAKTPKLSTFVPYQERGSLDRLANGGPGGPGGEGSGPLTPHSAFSKDTAPRHASKREIYL